MAFKKTGIAILGIILCFAAETHAQGSADTDGANLQPLSVNGSIGFTAQAYRASGIENRRAPGLAQGTANLNFSALGFRSGINLLYSTDQSQLRQNMNNLSFDASWRWMQFSAGDISPTFSTYGLRGTTIRGGHFKATPGNILLEFVGGRSQRAVRISPEQGFREPAFERWTVAGKVGVGRENSTHFHLSTHYSIDEKQSLDQVGNITPQENLTITPNVQIDFFGGRFSIQSEVTASAFTRDLNSTQIPTGDIVPGFAANLYKPTASTRITYAGEAQAELTLDRFGMTAGYERIQPGYRSLGLSRIRDDQQRILFNPTARFFENRLNVSTNVVLGRDNLLGNRLQTQKNRTIGTTIQASLSEQLMLNTSYNLYTNNVSSDSDGSADNGMFDQQQVSHTIMLQPTLTFLAGEHTHNISTTVSYMTISNEFSGGAGGVARDMSSETITTALSYSLTLPMGLSVNASGNYLTNDSDQFTSNTIGMNLGSSYAFFNRSLSISVNGGMNLNTNERQGFGGDISSERITNTIRQLTANMNAGYRLSRYDTLNLTLRTRNNQSIEGAAVNFSEMEANFRYQRGF